MMISTRGRYALRVMVDLAEHRSEGFVPLNEIAERQDISEKYLESILRALVKNGLLQGLRGKGGGYRLTRDPELYSVREILALTEDSLAPVACLDKGAAVCPRRDVCRTLDLWRGLYDVINKYLDGVTLAELADTGDPGDNYVI